METKVIQYDALGTKYEVYYTIHKDYRIECQECGKLSDVTVETCSHCNHDILKVKELSIIRYTKYIRTHLFTIDRPLPTNVEDLIALTSRINMLDEYFWVNS